MTRSFDPIRILKSLSTHLLRELFFRHDAVRPAPWAYISRREIRPLLDAWDSMSDANRGRMQVVLHEIFVLSQEIGLQALAEELRSRHPQHLPEFSCFEHRYDRALWAWLNTPDAFEEAAIFARADSLSQGRYWERWPGATVNGFQVGEQQIASLQKALRDYYWSRQMRGQHCRIHHHRRHTGVDYLFAYLDNWPDQVLAFQEDGELEPLSGRYAFTNVFAFDSSNGLLDLVARGGREVRSSLRKVFCQAVFNRLPADVAPLKPAYSLDHLLTSGFVLPTAPEDRVASIRLTRIRIASRVATRSVRYEEIGFSPRTNLAAAEAELRERIAERSLQPDLVSVKSVGFSLKVRPAGKSQQRTLSFNVNAPNTCDLKDQADDLRAVGERCLKLWGISRA
jgi:hypothetical protein